MALLCLAVASSGCLGSGGGGLFGGAGPGPKDYVSADQYTKWVIEVDTVQGQEPPSGVLDFVKGRLASVVSKPDGIEVLMDDTLPARGGTWSQKDLLDYSKAHFETATSGKTAAIHLVFVDGTYDQGNVLGATFSRETSSGRVVETGPIMIFSKVIRDNCSPLSGCLGGDAAIFRAVLVHEFGHAIGLVDNGVEMQRGHEDSAHPGHSSNCDSVMYWEVETTGIFSFLCGGRTTASTEFDADDRADLCAAGGRC
ncbi:MAG TPA: hypothetical protein VM327_06540 [Candidatus Thermoplasmatota archaeon]|nr:hypothetical protein [Candidatus Thermoplasmatota archaeon]